MEDGTEGGVYSALFQKFWKNALTAVIYGLNFSFKMQFSRAFRRRNQRFFRAGSFFLVSYMDFLSKCHNSKKTPLPKKIPGCALVFIVLSGTIFDFFDGIFDTWLLNFDFKPFYIIDLWIWFRFKVYLWRTYY